MTQFPEHKLRYRYDDFILTLRRTKMEYTVEARAPNGDRKKRPFALPEWSEDVATFTHYFQVQAEQVKADQNQVQIMATEKVRAFGSQLFTTLFRGGILTCYRQGLENIMEARNDTPSGCVRGLRILLDMEHAPELACIPWEFLYDAEKEGQKFLCLDPRTPLVRRMRLGARPYENEGQVRFLLLSANPRGTDTLTEQIREIKIVRDTLAANKNVNVEDRLAASAGDLRWAMREEWPHIIHFTIHGSVSKLSFEREDGTRQDLTAGQLMEILNTYPGVRLVVINACEAGEEIAETLAQGGVPAIIAMQFMVTDLAAKEFSREFYKALVNDYPLETALSWGRQAMAMAISGIEAFEWATPVLYLQTDSQKVFDDALTTSPDVDKLGIELTVDARQRYFEFLFRQGEHLYRQGNQHKEALAFLEKAKGLWHPEFGGELDREIDNYIHLSKAGLEDKRYKAQTELSEKSLLRGVEAYIKDEQWGEALNLLQMIGYLNKLRLQAREERPTFSTQDLPSHVLDLYRQVYKEFGLSNERQARQTRLAVLYRRGEVGWNNRDWDEAIIFFDKAAQEVNALKVLNANVDDCYRDAEARASDARKQKRLHWLYQRGLSLAEQQQWHEAVNVFEQITGEDETFQDAVDWLQRVYQERNLDEAYHRGIDAMRDGNWQFAIQSLQTIPAGARRYPDAQLALKYAHGRLYMEQERWPQAVEALDALVRRRPDYEGDAQQQYDEARFRRDLKARYQEGCRRMEDGDWQGAKADLQWVKSQQEQRQVSIYSDVDQRLRRIDEEITLADQYQQAQRFFATGNWERAILHLQTILNLDDNYQDACEMLAQAQARLGAEAAYQRGVEATLGNDWSVAVQAFEEALRLQPDHQEAQKGLETARRNLALEDNYQQGITAYRRGVTTYDVATLEKAIHHLEQVAQLDPEFRDAADRLKESRRLLEAERNYRMAVQAEEAEAWNQAVEAWQRVAELAHQLSRDHRDAADRLRQATRHKELADLYHQSQTHRANQDWAEAEAVLSDLVARAADYGLAPYKDAQAQLDEAKCQARIAARFDDGLLCMRSERWEDAITMFREVIRLDAGHKSAKVQLAEAERQRKLQIDYQAGLAALKSGDWATAIGHLRCVLKEDKSYKDVATHLATARHRRKLADLYRRGQEHANNGEWDQAFACFDEVKREDPTYQEIGGLWFQARENKELNALHQRAQALKEKGELEEALRLLREIKRRKEGNKV